MQDWRLIAAFYVFCASVAYRCEAQEADENTATAGNATVEMIQRAVVAAIAKAEPSVVSIARVRIDEQNDQSARSPFPRSFGGQATSPSDPDFVPSEYGAGVVVGSQQVLTTYQTIGNPAESNYFVWSQRRPYQASVLAADPWFNLAVLQLEQGQLKPIAFGDGSEVKKGRFVIALGNPEAIARDGKPSAKWGIVANRLRRAPRTPERSADPLGRETIHHYGTLLQIDARLDSGFHGGALLNLRGEMIGFLTALTADAGVAAPAGLAIPVNAAFRRIVQLLQGGQRPDYGFLGVAPEPLADALRRRGAHGASVGRVLAGTPAALSGVRNGDLISHVGGQAVFDDDDLIRLVGSMAPNTTTTLQLMRGDPRSGDERQFEVQVVLAKKHIAALRPSIGEFTGPRWRGLRVDYSTAVADFEDYALRIARFGGVVVEDVEEESPGWLAGIRAGTFISQVDGAAVNGPADFHRRGGNNPADVRLQVVDRQGRTAIRTISP
jgi:serine protease Do